MTKNTVDDLQKLITRFDPKDPFWSSQDGLRDPIPLTRLVEVPPFPVDALPKTIADMVNGVSEAAQVDPAMAATSALAALATCTGGHAEIECRTDWRETLNLYTATIAVSGERKSAVQAFMTGPLREAERRLVRGSATRRAAAEHQKRIADKRAEHLRGVAAKAKPEDAVTARQAAVEAADEADAIVVPPIPRILADDTTSEAATSLLCDHGGAIGIISTEGGIFDIMAGRYSSSPDLNSMWLKAHSGEEIRVDRKGRPPEHIPRPALTLGLMIQPVVVSTIAANQQFRGRGLLARFVYTHPISKVGRRQIPAPTVDPEVKAAYETAVTALATAMRERTGGPVVLKLTDAAALELQDIEIEVEPTLVGDGELASLADWGSKYVGAVVARIGGILHFAEHGVEKGSEKPVGVETIKSARRIGEYFKAATINVFAEMNRDPVTAAAIYLLDRVRHLRRAVVTERDMLRAAQRFSTHAELMPAVNRLVGNGWLVKMGTPTSTGGRPHSPAYRVVEERQEDRSQEDGSVSNVSHFLWDGKTNEPTENLSGRTDRRTDINDKSTQIIIIEKNDTTPDSFFTEPHEMADTTDRSPVLLDDPPAHEPPLPAKTFAGLFSRLRADLGIGDSVHDRTMGVITRRLQKVQQATRAELKQALDSKDRADFDAVFDALVAEEYLVAVSDEGSKTTRYRLANP